MFDIDHFKKINDRYGHEAGDQVLVGIGAELNVVCRSGARLGGEEFCVLIDGNAGDALECAIDVQRSIRSLRFAHDGEAFTVTCSFGIAEWEEGDTIDRMLRRADIAMYEAKRAGRDQIIVADTYTMTTSHDEWSGAIRASRRA